MLGTAPARAVRTTGSSGRSCGITGGPFGFSSTAAITTAAALFFAIAPPAFSGAFAAIHCRIISICASGSLSPFCGMYGSSACVITLYSRLFSASPACTTFPLSLPSIAAS